MSGIWRRCATIACMAAAVGWTAHARAEEAQAPSTAPSAEAASPAPPDLAKGRRAFQRYCTVCHGMRGEGGFGPSLQGISKRLSPDDITRQLMEPRGSMPRLYPAPIDPRLLADVRGYLMQLP